MRGELADLDALTGEQLDVLSLLEDADRHALAGIEDVAKIAAAADQIREFGVALVRDVAVGCRWFGFRKDDPEAEGEWLAWEEQLREERRRDRDADPHRRLQRLDLAQRHADHNAAAVEARGGSAAPAMRERAEHLRRRVRIGRVRLAVDRGRAVVAAATSTRPRSRRRRSIARARSSSGAGDDSGPGDEPDPREGGTR